MALATARSTTPSAYPALLSPLRVGQVTLRNRLVNLPQGMGYTNRGRVEDEDIAYHRRRAVGGTALIITGGTATHPSSQTRSRTFVEAWDPEVIAGLQRRSDAIHAEGALVVGQLFNLGRYMAGEDMSAVPLAPSAVRAPGLAHAPMQMGRAEIDEVVAGFVISARHMVQGDNDGVELHAAHGYLLAQFLSAASNQRDDGYGGDLRGRARLLVEIARAVRAEIGDRILGVRLSVDDEAPGGTTPEESAETIELLRDVGLDYVSLAVGLKGAYVKDSSAAEGAALATMKRVAVGLDVPVMVSQRIRTPELAEQVVASGDADLVGLARALIADPDWVDKASRGQGDRIRLCVGDVQDCRSHLAGGLRCMVNPEVGNETSPLMRATTTRDVRRIAVVGAGPAGLEFARRAATAGHRVTVYEQQEQAGGQLLLAARAPGREELADFVAYQSRELARLGVQVSLGTRVDDLTELDADLVVAATGAAPGPLPTLGQGPAGPAVTSTWAAAADDSSDPLGRVVVLDDGRGGWPMVTATLVVSDRADSVVIISPGGSVVGRVPSESANDVRRRLRSNGVRWQLDSVHRGFEGDRLRVEANGTGEVNLLEADLFVVEVDRIAEDQVWRSARDRGHPIAAIGDALAPRTMGNAVRDAFELEGALNQGDLSFWGRLVGRDRSRSNHVDN